MRFPSAETSYGVPQWPRPIGGTLSFVGSPNAGTPSRLHRTDTLRSCPAGFTTKISAPSRRHTGWSPPSPEITKRCAGPEIVRTDTSGRPDSFDTYAIHRPSGDILASRSLKLSARRGCAPPFSSAGTSQMSVLCPAITLMSKPRDVQSVGSQYSRGQGRLRTTPVPSPAAMLRTRLPGPPGRLPVVYAR